MSPDEIERTMQFLLSQQAQFAADLATLEDKTHRIADGLIGLTGIVGRVTDSVGQLAEGHAETDKRLEDAETRLKEADARFREADARLSDQIRAVESHLGVVIDMFERHLRSDQNPPPS